MTNTGQILKHIYGLTVAILLTHVCEVKAKDFPETSIATQFSYTDEAPHHNRQRRAELFTDYMAEIEIEASSISVIEDMKDYVRQIMPESNITVNGEVITILDTSFTTVCNLHATDYQCQCEDQYFWPCDKCNVYGSCSATNDTCSCINARPIDGQYCQPISEMTNITACAQPPTDQCQLNSSVCGPNSTCTNVNGGYNCSCLDGFTATFPNLTISINNTCTVQAQTAVYDKVIRMSLRINEIFDTSLTNPDDKNYKDKAEKIKLAIDAGYSSLPTKNYKQGSANVIGFRSGSIIADYTIIATNSNIDFTSANKQVSDILSSAGIPVTQDDFYESEETILTTKETKEIYPQQSVELKCTRPNSTVLGGIKWTVNEKYIAENSTKYTITNDGSTLTMKNISGSDSGRYSCIIQRTSLPYIQWQNIDIEPRPNIIVDKTEIMFPCEDRIVPLKCCAEGYSIQWHPITGDEEKDPESGCITLKHKISSTNCVPTEIFTCKLKDMEDLQAFDYSSKRITVQTIRGEFDCKNESLGVGKIGNSVTGPCENGKEGQITYQCQQINGTGHWILTQRECVIDVIKDLERKAEILVVEQIPAFVANLSNTSEHNIADITESSVTVETIVGILVEIASISQPITIDKPVMEDFLKTVNIIVSEKAITSWQTLNNKNSTKNTSTELLQAIEDISDRLSDENENYMIKESSIQLNRTKIEKFPFIGTSLLPNSTTMIVIPTFQSTTITIIVFTSLDNVLPTRNTSSNESRTSENRINGDVVVVKVNETNKINNISFTFDITDTSLKNPQCVFWNFSLDRWDSTGCKVKGNEMDKVTCECQHTTSFSILMSPFANNHPALAYITYIGVAISMASLILCLIIEMIVWKSVTRNDTAYMRHVAIVNIAVSLLIANICFIIGAAIAEQNFSVSRCSPVVFFMHFFYLALFFWMLISALLLLYRTVMVLSQMSRTNMMAIAFTVGYCAPLLIAVITVASTARYENYVSKENACWLNWYQSKALLAFVIPALTIVTFNLLVLIVVLYKMLRRGVGATSQPDERHTLKVIVRCVAILTPIFGLTWGFGIGTMVSPNLGIHVVFAILNSFQGFFVLVFGTLLDSKVREALAGKLSLKNLSSSPTRTTNAGTSSGLGFFERLRRRNVYNMSDPRPSAASDSSSASDTLMNL